MVAFKTRPPSTTWFQPGPRVSCSAHCPELTGFGAASRPVAPHTCVRPGCPRVTSAALVSFHFSHPDNWLCGYPHTYSIKAPAWGLSTPGAVRCDWQVQSGTCSGLVRFARSKFRSKFL
jgi:hypothetical protein